MSHTPIQHLEFTPVLVGTSVAGTATYARQEGFLTRIGNLCIVNIFMSYTGHTGTGNATITGLPFAAVAASPSSDWLFNMGISSWAIGSDNTPIGTLANNANVIALRRQLSGGASIQNLAMDAASTIYLQGQYMTDEPF